MKIIRSGLYLADLNPQHGTEAGKIRPVVVMQTEILNEIKHPSTLVVPCTTNLKGYTNLRVLLKEGSAGNLKRCEIMVDQLRAIDIRRLKKFIGILPKEIFSELYKKTLVIIGERD